MRASKLLIYFIVFSVLLLTGCKASGNHRAPIEQRNAEARQTSNVPSKKSSLGDQDAHSTIYVVEKGDTLYSIAFDHGLDYREVAEQNNIENPSAIQIGQQIKLLASDEVVSERPRIESRPLAPIAAMVPIKDQPKILKLPYSDKALAQIASDLDRPVSAQAVVVVAPSPAVILPKESDSGSDDGLEWAIPTKGKVIGEYSESANRKGLDIAGSKGQPVLASAAGKVVYSGSGLRGYGKLVIIKHNKTFLSAYAHNDQILVKEGQSVVKGQKISEMGSSDTDQVKLHFEIRKFGKPVDPAKFLNLAKF